MAEDSLKVSAGSGGPSVEVSGVHAERLSVAVLDLLSPFTESAGWIGDIVRVRRQAAVLRALEEAHRMSHERNLEFPRKSTRLIEEWVQGSSYAEDDNVSRKWSQLLLSNTPDMAQIVFCDFLRKIGKNEARWVDDLWSSYDMNLPITELYARKVEQVRSAARDALNSGKFEDELESLANDFYEDLKTKGILLRSIEYEAFTRESSDAQSEMKRFTLSWEPDLIYPDIFASLGILRLDQISVHSAQRKLLGANSNVVLRAYFLTRIGGEFMRETYQE